MFSRLLLFWSGWRGSRGSVQPEACAPEGKGGRTVVLLHVFRVSVVCNHSPWLTSSSPPSVSLYLLLPALLPPPCLYNSMCQHLAQVAVASSKWWIYQVVQNSYRWRPKVINSCALKCHLGPVERISVCCCPTRDLLIRLHCYLDSACSQHCNLLPNWSLMYVSMVTGSPPVWEALILLS